MSLSYRSKTKNKKKARNSIYDEISCIEKTFELVIIWMNRLLFIKLFEGQLITFNGDEKAYHILDSDKIIDFQNLQDLFFEVLGKKERDDNDFIKKFEKIPYLNSSLFERYDIEKQGRLIKDWSIIDEDSNSICISASWKHKKDN